MPLGPRLSARLMEGATLGCPLTDRCQQRPLSSKHQAGCANLASGRGGGRMMMTQGIAQSANADTRGTARGPSEAVTQRDEMCLKRTLTRVRLPL